MKWFNNLKIGKRIISGFLVVALVSVMVGVLGISNLKQANNNADSMYANNLLSLLPLNDTVVSFAKIRTTIRDEIIDPNPSNYDNYETTMKQQEDLMNKSLNDYSKNISSNEEQVTYDQLKPLIDQFPQIIAKIVPLARANKNEEAMSVLHKELTPVNNKIIELIQKEFDINAAQAKKLNQDSNSNANNNTILMIGIILLGLIISGGFGLFISRGISNPLKKLVDAANKIAEGDMDLKVDATSKDEIGILMVAFSKMVGTLTALLNETDKLVVETQEGKLGTRGNAKAFAGSWGTLVGGINNLMNTLVGHLDAMPSPVMLIDKDFNIVYMNKNGSELLSTTQKQLIGTKCYDNFKTSDCKTGNCACAMSMQQGQKVSREAAAHPNGMNLDILYTASPLKDGKNQVIGAMEMIVDQTAVMNAARVSKKQAKYQEKETAKLLVNIENLAQGKLQCNSKIEPTDEDTNSIGEMFSNIYGSFEESLNAMSSYVKDTANVLTEISKGNLDLSITGDYKGDFVEIKSSVNSIIDSLNEVLSDMNNASGQVAAGARQVSDSAQALSQGSTEQASALEELTASMEEISTETKHNATNATQANELALAAKEEATKGNDQMKGMLKAMDDINEGSGNIFKIIKVIDEIAFQTNILALNAAVEAARAGQHGKGFAVVAEEVRNLAARSANAAKETTALIEGSIKKVEGGTKIANDTAVALSQIVEEVTKVTNLVGEIAIASNEQSLGINQVNQGILQVSDVVQTNSATSEESAAASEELSSQAELLREEVSRFKLKKSTGSSHGGFDDLNPEVLRMLEEMSNKKKGTNNPYSNQGYAEAAATSSKPKISLSDREFGKY
jgi:methyl-accepting chemotaxis protein